MRASVRQFRVFHFALSLLSLNGSGDVRSVPRMKRVILLISQNLIRAESEEPAIGADRLSARSGDWKAK
jgi:hypothetical protein